MNFRKKPVVVEAHQWFKNGDHPDDYAKDTEGFESGELRVFTGAERKAKGWEGDVVRYYRHPDVSGEKKCTHCGQRMHIHGWIDTLEGGHNVCPGDWIITGVKGERYPCKPDIFAMTYEPAPAPSADALDAARFRFFVDPHKQMDSDVMASFAIRIISGDYPTLDEYRAAIDAAMRGKEQGND